MPLVDKKVVEMFERLKILTARELHARFDIELDKYKMKIQIESRICADMAQNNIIPTAIKYQNTLIQNVKGINDILGKDAKTANATQIKTILEISKHIEMVKNNVDQMVQARKDANKITDAYKCAVAYCEKVKPYMDTIRYHADKLELIVDDELWPLPKMRELLFTK
jgi:glutamine synthetase